VIALVFRFLCNAGEFRAIGLSSSQEYLGSPLTG